MLTTPWQQDIKFIVGLLDRSRIESTDYGSIDRVIYTFHCMVLLRTSYHCNSPQLFITTAAHNNDV